MATAVPLLGRAHERRRLKEVLERAREGHAMALALRGEPGIGKTTLLDAVRDAAAPGFRVLHARGHEPEQQVPWAGLSLLLPQDLVARRTELATRHRTALDSALAFGAPAPHDAVAVAGALLGLLGIAAAHRPLLVVVDDLQWWDESSRVALLLAARRLEREPVALLLGVRDEPGVPSLPPTGVEELELGPLGEDDARALLARGPALDPQRAAQVLATAQGNPLALVEIPHAAEPASAAEPLSPGERLQRAFARRLAELPGRTREALLVAAVAEGAPPDAFGRALHARDLTLEDLSPAEATGLLVDGAFRHPLVRAAAYHGADAPARREAHAAVAAALPPGPRRAWHRADAALLPDERVADELADAAQQARDRGAGTQAGELLARAAALTPDAALCGDRHAEAAEALLLTGHVATAERELAIAEGLDAPRAVLARARLAIRHQDVREGRRLLLAEAERRAAEDPITAAVLMLEATIAMQLSGSLQAQHDVVARARELLGDRDPRLRAFCDLIDGHTLVAAGDPRGDAQLDAAVDALTAHPDPPPSPEVATSAAIVSMWAGAWDRTERLLDWLDEALLRAGAARRRVLALAARAELDRRRGRLASARARVTEAIELGEAMDEGGTEGYARTVRATLLAQLGDDAGGRADVERALQIANEIGGDLLRLYARRARGDLALAAGRVEEAAEQFAEVQAALEHAGIAEPGFALHRPDRVEALARLGREDEARTELEAFERSLDGRDRPLERAAAARCRALLRDGDAGPEHHAAEALAHHDAVEAPFERARTLLVLGELRRRARRRAEARDPLREALTCFEGLGAVPWAERARVELEATGERRSAGAVPDAAKLTAHELQVALHVARGMSNKEAAAALFVSVRTVEAHLRSVYRKLGLRSRTDLAVHFAAGEPSGEPLAR